MVGPAAAGSSTTTGAIRRRSRTSARFPATEIADLTDGRLSEDVPVALNRLALAYDHVLICGPVFPHEVAGFSGGTKYLFPGIAAPEIIHFTHWLGALITNHEMIGTIDTPVRAVIDRAAALLDRPLSLLAMVVTHDGVAGVFCGDPHEAWRHAALLSARRHVVWVDRRLTACCRSCPDSMTTSGRRRRACTRWSRLSPMAARSSSTRRTSRRSAMSTAV